MAKKQTEVIDFVLTEDINVAFLTETHLKSDNNFRLPNHIIILLNQIGQAGGGVAIALKRNLEDKMLPDFNLTTIEAVGVDLASLDGLIICIVVYCPNQCRDPDASSMRLKNDIQRLTRCAGGLSSSLSATCMPSIPSGAIPETTRMTRCWLRTSKPGTTSFSTLKQQSSSHQTVWDLPSTLC